MPALVCLLRHLRRLPRGSLHHKRAVGNNDDARSPNEKNVLRETFEKAKVPAEIEVYGAAHGWCPPDSQVHNQELAEKAWSRLLALYSKAL